MKLESTRERIGDAVSRAEKIAGQKSTLPVLAGIYMKASGSMLEIRSTNLDLGITLVVPAKVIEEGEIVVPAHVLSSFLSTLPSEKTITLETKDNTLEVKAAGARTTLKTLPVEEFPLVPELGEDNAFLIPGKELALGIKSVVYAASAGSMKPELASVLVTYRDGDLIFVATDSFRLAEKRLKTGKIPHFKEILIPQKNAAEIARIFDRVEDDVSISVAEHQAAFRTEGLYLVTRVVEGTFPDYRQIIPEGTSTSATMLKKDLENALRTNLIFADAFNQLTFSVSPKDKRFEISSKNANVGESVSSVPAALEGEDLVVSINHRYLVDCFQALGTDSLALSFNGAGKAVLVRGVGDKSFLYLVMPMNR
jgi:DNA polymerase-3 subunit beta